MKRHITAICALVCGNALFAGVGYASDATRAVSCVGTEPFWSLKITPQKLSFDRLGFGTMTIANGGPRAAEGQMIESLALYQGRLQEDSRRFMNVIISPRSCSDGMSDTDYPFEVLVLSGSSLFRGCCR